MAPSPYHGAISTRRTPQSEPIPGKDMIANSEGAYVFEIDARERLRRFLILGTEGGSYYAGEREMTQRELLAVKAIVDELGIEAVSEVELISDAGRAPKNSPALVVLAMALAHKDEYVRQRAARAINVVARTSTHLFELLNYMKDFRGWGRIVTSAVSRWYLERPIPDLAYQAVKYRQREGWTHGDVLRKAHPVTREPNQRALIDWILRGPGEEMRSRFDAGQGGGPGGERLPADDPLRILEGYELAQRAEHPLTIAKYVREYGLPREALPTEHLKSADVWDALLHEGGHHGMPVGAMVRNLATMTRVGLLDATSDATQFVIERLTNEDALRGARIHPLNVLNAMKTYESGKSERGSATWSPVGRIVDALDEAFYLSFANAPATGLRWMLAVDLSGSMDGQKTDYRGYSGHFPNVAGMPNLSPREAAMAMALVAARSGDPYEIVGFTAQHMGAYAHAYQTRSEAFPGLSVLPFTPRQRLDDVIKETQRIFPGGTDASLPMRYAAQAGRQVDVFVVYTDSESWAGDIHPSQALQAYREKMGIDAKLICVNFVSSPHSIADPSDPGMLDVVGFDSAAPALMTEFAQGFPSSLA